MDTPEDFTCAGTMDSLLFWLGVAGAVLIFGACIAMPLWFGTLQFSDFFSLGRALWAGRTGS